MLNRISASTTKPVLEESTARYRDLFEQMPDGVFRSRRDGTMLAANPALVRMLGYPSEEALCEQANAQDFYVFPEQRDPLLALIDKDGEARDITIDIRRKNRTELTVKASIAQISGGPDHGAIYQGTFRDITDLKNAADALKDSEEHFRALSDNTLDLVTVIDENAEILYASPSALDILGYKPVELCGTSALEHVHRDDVSSLTRVIGNVFRESGRRNVLTIRCHHRDGRTIDLESVGTSFVDRKGQSRAVINSRDITERLLFDRQLEQTQKLQALGQLTGGIAHDFNNLLTVVVGSLQLIDMYQPPSDIAEQVDVALRAAIRGADLTRQLLAFAPTQPIESKVVNINKVVADMEPMLRQRLGARMDIQLITGGELCLVEVDPTQLESSILNLAVNSHDATKGRGKLTIETRTCESCSHELQTDTVTQPCGCTVLSVVDDGCGMTDETLKRATEPFYTTKTGNNGSGLGLSTAYGFARQSGGHLRISNRAQKGARVEIHLPCAADTRVRSQAAEDLSDVPHGGETILVVDDNTDVRTSAARLIERLGYEVLQAANSDEALQILESSRVHLLFTDVRMPGKTGFELISEVNKRFPGVRALLTSGFMDEATLQSGAKLRDFAFISKPYKKKNLAIQLRAVLDELQ